MHDAINRCHADAQPIDIYRAGIGHEMQVFETFRVRIFGRGIDGIVMDIAV